MDAEVGVIGVGTIGSMAILELAKRNVSVLGFEQFWIGHDRSAGAGDTRLFRTPHNTIYKKMYYDAYDMWQKLGSDTNRELLTLGKALIIGEDNSDFMINAINNLDEYNLDYEILEKKQAEKNYPQHNLLPNEIMVVDKGAGFVRPELSIFTAVEQAKIFGANILGNTRIDRIETDGELIRIWSNGKEYRVRKLIVASGAWTSKLMGWKEIITPKRLVSTWFLPKKKDEFTSDKFPVFIRMNNEFGIYGTPSVDNSMVKVSIRNESDTVNDADLLNRNVSANEISRISDIIDRFLPELYSSPARVATYMDAYTKDKNPIVSKLPKNENIVLLSGYSGHGFKLAPVMGRIAAELVLDGFTDYIVESLSLNRFEGLN